MKIQSASSQSHGARFAFRLPRKDSVALSAAVALAFIFVTTCIFTLG